ncbi:MAG: hypothetical protein FVQ80_09295 [Planctomycetes bacterium]|nr:hypothetical protein [Planctomycetota bacterium]
MAKKAIFVMLLIWTTQLCAEGASQTEPNTSKPTHNLQENLGSKVKDKPIDKGSDEPEKGTGGILKNDTEDTSVIKTLRLQYTQLLEIHRSYFTIFLRVLSTYLAIMGACITIVHESIRKMKKNEKDGSKTVLMTLTVFAFVTSILFLIGLVLGQVDAGVRNKQIINVTNQLGIDLINVQLLGWLFITMICGTVAIIGVWIAMFIRGIMLCRKT